MTTRFALHSLITAALAGCASVAAQPGAAAPAVTRAPAAAAVANADTGVAPGMAASRAPAATAVARADLADDSVAPDRDAAAIAALRAAGPGALTPLLAAYDAAAPGPARVALGATIDRVAAQRYATVSRLYWYTDLAAAEAAAQASGRPILSLRLLGRLDEDRSCANSRFFRTALYADPAVAALLRDKFVLHWSSERDIPRVTIAFADGRRVESTVTGNSAHLVLDATGQVLDALPGLYMPAAFIAELEPALALAASLAGRDAAARASLLRAYHVAIGEAAAAAWRDAAGTVALPSARRLGTRADIESLLAAGERASISKAMIEVPMLLQVSAGTSPGDAPTDVRLWAAVGQAMYGIGDLPKGVPGTALAFARGVGLAATPSREAEPHVLAPAARTLMAAVHGDAPGDGPVADVLDGFEVSMAADTARNELILRPQIADRLAAGPMTFDEFTAWLYPTVFAMPRDDIWLGLAPRTAFTGLPDDGLVR